MSEKAPWIVPLHNFDSDTELAKLDEKICLRRISEDELPSDVVERLPFDVFFKLAISEAKYVLEGAVENFLSYTNDILLALRLLKTGDVRGYIAIRLKEAHLRKGFRVFSNPRPFVVQSDNAYILKKEETADFLALWKKVKNSTSEPHLEFPLRKFNETYDKPRFEDKIIDYMTAFESFVFYERDKTIEPTGEVIGIAVGMLIGNSQRERSKIKEILEKAYKLRNAEVHGNARQLRKWKQEDIKQLSTEVEEYLRRALRKFVEE